MLPVNIKVIKKNGRQIVRIHWFVYDLKGPIRNNAVQVNGKSRLVSHLGGGVGYIACQPKLDTLKTPIVNGMYVPVCCSGEARAVSCPECMNTPEFKKAMEDFQPKLLEEPEKKHERVYITEE